MSTHLKPYTIELPGATYEVEADCIPAFKPRDIDFYIKSVVFEEVTAWYMVEKRIKKDLPEIENKIKELHADEEPCFTDDNSAD